MTKHYKNKELLKKIKLRQKAQRLLLNKLDLLQDNFPRSIKTLHMILEQKQPKELQAIIHNAIKKKMDSKCC